ncbi:MAG: hypothetical protein V2A73_16320 [Pseudomonadota bacterium]
MRHYISRGIWKPLLVLFGASRERSWVSVTASTTTIRFGLFELTLAHDELESAKPVSWPLLGGLGWRTDFCGSVVLVGSRQGVVEIRLRNPRRIKLLGLPVTARRIFVSLEDDQAFLADLRLPAPPT